jgi:hypothetical protein
VFLNSNLFSTVKKTTGLKLSRVSCVRVICITVCCVYLVRAVHKFHSWACCKHLKMGDQWTVLNTSGFDRTCMLALQASADDKETTSTLSRSKPYSSDDKSTRFRAIYYSAGKRIMKQITTVHVRSSFVHVSCWRWL